MRIWILPVAIISLVLIIATGAILSVWPNGGPSGTLDEAAVKMRSERLNVAKIVKIAEDDTSVADVDAHIDVVKADDLDLNDPTTRNYVKSYKAIQSLMVQGGFLDLDLLRDKDSQHELKWIDLYVFGTGFFRNAQPIRAEWRAPGEPLVHSKDQRCITVNDSWYVCPVDF